MDYKKHYDQLIMRGQGRLLEGYTEKHHIVPRCMGGSDDASNMVALTAEEHYVAHQLLVKMYPGAQGLIFAAHRMTSNPTGKRANNKLYGWLRKKAAKATSKLHKGKTVSKESRQKISEAAKNRAPISEETRHKMSEANKGRKHSKESCRNMSKAAKRREMKKREAKCLGI